jgi:hypothetical protein
MFSSYKHESDSVKLANLAQTAEEQIRVKTSQRCNYYYSF